MSLQVKITIDLHGFAAVRTKGTILQIIKYLFITKSSKEESYSSLFKKRLV